MREPDWKHCSEAEMWQYVAAHLASQGISTVLVGGAAAAVHSHGAYRSGDIDLLIDSFPLPTDDQLKKTMERIGFVSKGRHYRHPKCQHLFVEFVSGTLHIGKDYRIEPEDCNVGTVVVRRLSATDSVKDRLTSYVYFKARECLDQAVLIAKANKINWRSVQRWAAKENEEMMRAVAELRKLTAVSE